MWSKLQKSKLFYIAWNGEKIGRNWFLDFLATPPSKMNIYIEYLEKCLSILFTVPPLSPPQAKSWHGEVRCSHSANLDVIFIVNIDFLALSCF